MRHSLESIPYTYNTRLKIVYSVTHLNCHFVSPEHVWPPKIIPANLIRLLLRIHAHHLEQCIFACPLCHLFIHLFLYILKENC